MDKPGFNPFPGIFALAGSALFIAGIWLIYRPGALIAAGLMLMTLAFFGRRGDF
jgi:hypothetical protein